MKIMIFEVHSKEHQQCWSRANIYCDTQMLLGNIAITNENPHRVGNVYCMEGA